MDWVVGVLAGEVPMSITWVAVVVVARGEIWVITIIIPTVITSTTTAAATTTAIENKETEKE